MEERVIEWQQYGTTVVNPLGLAFTFIMWVLILFLRRERKIFPFLMLGCFMTAMQRIVIFGINFPYMRIAILIGLAMVLANSQYKLELNKIDKVMLWFMVSKVVLCTCQLGTAGLVEKLGQICDTALAYFFLRYIFQDIEEYEYIMKFLAVASIVVAAFMINEKITGKNWFSIFGGVPEFTMVREGKLRAQAAIGHPILAGTFGALLIPFMWVLWNQKKKLHAAVGAISGTIITFTSASSGPVLTLMAGFLGIFMWRYRELRKKYIWIIIGSLFVVQLFMNNPIWFIFGAIDFTGGSTGYFRSILLDQAIRHFPEWALFGTRASGSWGWGLQDTTNQFLVEGFYAGFLTLFLFAYIIKLCFNAVGRALDTYKDNIDIQRVIWALGVILFAHCITFMGVSYFGHMEFFYYMSLAMISSLATVNMGSMTESNIVQKNGVYPLQG